MREQQLVDDISYHWRTDEKFRAWWREYMRRNDTAHLEYLRLRRGFGTNISAAPWSPELQAARARARARAYATLRSVRQRQAGE